MVRETDEERLRRELIELLKKALRALGLIPLDIGISDLRRRVTELLELLRGESPKLMLVGRTNAGKSALVNALVGRMVAKTGAIRSTTAGTAWFEVTGAGGGRGRTLRILDSQGAGQAEAALGPGDAGPLAAARSQVDREPPDLILFVVAAKERAFVADDVRFLADVQAHIFRRTGHAVPVIPVINKADELAPRDEGFGHPEKLDNIDAACDAIRRELAAHTLALPAEPVPVSSLVEYGPDGVTPARDFRWNIDVLVDRIYQALPAAQKLVFAGAVDLTAARVKLAGEIVDISKYLAVGVTVIPIPGADVLPLGAIEVTMVGLIVYISGQEVTAARVAGFLGALGIAGLGTLAFRQLIQELSKLLAPAASPYVASGMAMGLTVALGRAAISYFIENKPIAEVRRTFESDTGGLLRPPGGP